MSDWLDFSKGTAVQTPAQRVDVQTPAESDFSAPSTLPQTQAPRSLFDETVGSFEYGAADAGSNLAHFIGSVTGSKTIDSFGDDLDQFKADHPNYAPEEVDSAWDLISHPGALVSKVAGMTPYILGTAGLALFAPEALPLAGEALGGALVYSIESERAYRQAKIDGATEDEAVRAGHVSGIVNGGLQLILSHSFASFVGSGEANLVGSATEQALRDGASVGAGRQYLGFLGKQALVQTLQGGVNELIPLGVYGKAIQPGFIDRRLQDAVGAAAFSVLGVVGKGAKWALGADGAPTSVPEETPGKEIDTTSVPNTVDKLQNLGYSPDQASAVGALFDARAKVWSQATGNPPEQFYAKNPIENLSSPDLKQTGTVEGDGETQEKASSKQNLSTPQSATSEQIVADAKNIMDGYRVGDDDLENFYTTEVQQENNVPADAISGVGVNEGDLTQNPIGRFQFGTQDDSLSVNDISKPIADLWKTLGGDLSQDELNAMNKAFPKVKGQKIPQETKIADAFRRYVWDGKAVDNSLIPAFDTMQEWIKSTYGTLKDAGIKTQLNDAQKSFFDNILYKDTPTTEAKRGELSTLNVMLKNAVDSEPESGEELLQRDGSIKSLQEKIGQTQDDLQRLKEARFNPNSPSEGQLQEQFALPEQFGREMITNQVKRTGIQKATDEFTRWVSLSTPLNRYEWGRNVIEYLNDFSTAKQLHIGYWEDQTNKGAGELARPAVLSNLSKSDLTWMGTIDPETGQTNMKRLVDSTAMKPLNPIDIPEELNRDGISTAIRAINTQQRYLGERAEAYGIVTKRNGPQGGYYVPFNQPEGDRYPQIMLPEIRAQFIRGSGPAIDSITQAVLERNPELKDFNLTKQMLIQEYGDTDVKRNGQLERTRTIRNMPDGYFDQGKQNDIMYTGFGEVMSHSLDAQASRLEFAKRFGQGVLSNLENPQIVKLGKILGVEDITQTGNDALTQQLKAAGKSDWDLAGMDYQAKKELAGKMETQFGASREQMVQSIIDSSPKDLGPGQVKQLISFAKEIGGIAPESGWGANGAEIDPVDLLNKVKQRISTSINSNLDVMTKQYLAEGGDGRYLDSVLKVAQGIPLTSLPENGITRGARFVSSLLSAIQTPFASIPHAFQTLTQLPWQAGLRNYLKAIGTVISDPQGSRDLSTHLLGIRQAEWNWRTNEGYSLRNIGQAIQYAMTKGTGLDWVMSRNREIATQTFRLMAEDYQANGISEKQTASAQKMFGLSDKDIVDTNNHEMSDQTFAKIVQQGVGNTLFSSDRPYNKGLIENIPALRMLFAYNSYVLGTTRSNFGLINDFKESIFNHDVSGVFQNTTKLATALAGFVGAGVVTQTLRDAIKGTTPRSVDDSYWETMLGALNETAGLGMVHRLTDAFKYDGGVIEKTAFGLTPQLNALTQLFGTAIGYGRFGQLPIDSRMEQALLQQAPAVRAFSQWIDASAHPQLIPYQEARVSMRKFDEAQPGYTPDSSESQLNLNYFPVFEKVQRGDLEAAKSNALDFYKSVETQGGDLNSAVEGLRLSLIQKSPLNMSQGKLGKYLSSLAPENRQKFVRAQVSYMQTVNAIAPDLGGR